jgi:hypothetical protein
MLRMVPVLSLLLLPACATLVSGTDQTVTVSTTPSGASCTLDRVGERVGAVPATPGSLRVDKSVHDHTVTCSKEGFETASATHASKFNGATFGNLLAGGVIGLAIDASSGANFTYPSDIRLQLAALPPAPLPPPIAQDSEGDTAPAPIVARRVSRHVRGAARTGARLHTVAAVGQEVSSLR